MIGPLDMLALCAVLLIGVPHGAADASLAMQTRFVDSRPKHVAFMLGYIAIAAAMIGFWMLAPIPALAIFLAMTIYHFGRGDALAYGTQSTVVRTLIHGGFIVFVALAHEVDVTGLFRLLTDSDVWPLMVALRLALLLWLILFGLSFMRGVVSPRAAGEVTALMLVAFLLPPLIAFALYFCGVHSARHFKRLAQDSRINTPRHRRLAMVLALVSITAIILAAIFMQPASFSDGLMRSLFIGLAALTVPHMLLIDAFDLVENTKQETGHATA